METKKIWTGKKFSGPEKSEDFSRKQSKTSKIKHLVLSAGLAVLSGCDFSTSYVRTYSYPREVYFEPSPCPPPVVFFQSNPYFRDNFPYGRECPPHPYYQHNQFFVPNREHRHPNIPHNRQYPQHPRQDINQRGRHR